MNLKQTVESINAQFSEQFAALSDLAALCPAQAPAIQAVIQSYHMEMTPTLYQYFTLKAQGTSDIAVTKTFYKKITSENYTASILECVRECVAASSGTTQPAVQALAKQIQSKAVVVSWKKRQLTSCCGQVMMADSLRAELVCAVCGKTREASADPAATGLDPSRAKTAPGDASKPFHALMDRLEGRERFELAPKDKALLLDKISKLRLEGAPIGVGLMRSILKSARLNNLYDHTSAILRELTGAGPPTLDKHTREQVGLLFARISECFNSLKTTTNSRTYNSFFVYKSLEKLGGGSSMAPFTLSADAPPQVHSQLSVSAAQAADCRALLAFIPLQSTETMVKHDQMYKAICEYEAGHFGREAILGPFRPTAR